MSASILCRLCVVFAILSLLALAVGVPAGVSAWAVPDGFSAADWGQIRTLLPQTVDPLQTYIKASNTDMWDEFGYSVAISGNTAVVGAPLEDSIATGVNGNAANNGYPNSGAVYVFVQSDGIWSQQAYLKASNAEPYDRFGYSVAISDDMLVVGAPGEDSNATRVQGEEVDNDEPGSGAAYVFVRQGGIWSQAAYLKPFNTEERDAFGEAVAISGDTVAVGAQFENSAATGINGNEIDDEENTASASGAVYIFRSSDGFWNQEAYIKASNTFKGDRFGSALALSGNTLVVGAYAEDSNAVGVNDHQGDMAPDSGAVYVFTRNEENTWGQQAYLKASNTNSGDRFGASVAISGDTLVVGAPYEDSGATGVNMNGVDNSARDSGAAYVFLRTGSSWDYQAYLKASNTGAMDHFGHSVAVSGDMLVVGALYEQSNAISVNGDQGNNAADDSGAAYVFSRLNGAWTQQAYLKASNTDARDEFGRSVGVSGDVVIAGAPWEDGSATGLNGDAASDVGSGSGAAYASVVPPAVISSMRTNDTLLIGQSVDFTVTFSDPMTGVDESDFLATASSGIQDAAVTRVRGGPSEYIVSVDTGSGSGAIRLDLLDDDTILDADSNPLGSLGFGNGNFFSGQEYIVRPASADIPSFPSYQASVLEAFDTTTAPDGDSATFRLGDDALGRSYQEVLSFDTSSLPDNAVIVSAVLRIKRDSGPVGDNPFNSVGVLQADMCNALPDVLPATPARLNATPTLPKGRRDGLPSACLAAVSSFNTTPVDDWYSTNLPADGRENINLTGEKHFRLRFDVGKRHNQEADYITFRGGSATIDRPVLIFIYYLP